MKNRRHPGGLDVGATRVLMFLRSLQFARITKARGPVCSILLFLVVGAGAVPQDRRQRVSDHAPAGASVIEIQPSALVERVDQYLERHPTIPESQVIDYVNSKLEQLGVNYYFEIRDFIEENHLKPFSGRAADLGGEEPYVVALKLADGRDQKFLLDVGDYGPCGERIATLPVTEVTASVIVIVAGGKRFRARRPASFGLDSMELVDATMRNVIRGWEVPYGSVPAGVSADGTTVYVDRTTVAYRKEIWLGISDRAIHFEPVASPTEQSSGEWIQEHPKDPNNAYLSFMRFRVRGKDLIIRFSAPCT